MASDKLIILIQKTRDQNMWRGVCLHHFFFNHLAYSISTKQYFLCLYMHLFFHVAHYFLALAEETRIGNLFQLAGFFHDRRSICKLNHRNKLLRHNKQTTKCKQLWFNNPLAKAVNTICHTFVKLKCTLSYIHCWRYTMFKKTGNTKHARI